MSKPIDLSDLLKVDERLDFGWRFAKISDGKLHLKFLYLGKYKVLNDESRVDGDIWYLIIQEKTSGCFAAMIEDQYHEIPKGVRRILLREVKYIE